LLIRKLDRQSSVTPGLEMSVNTKSVNAKNPNLESQKSPTEVALSRLVTNVELYTGRLEKIAEHLWFILDYCLSLCIAIELDNSVLLFCFHNSLTAYIWKTFLPIFVLKPIPSKMKSSSDLELITAFWINEWTAQNRSSLFVLYHYQNLDNITNSLHGYDSGPRMHFSIRQF